MSHNGRSLDECSGNRCSVNGCSVNEPEIVSGEDIAWLKWKRALEGHGVLKKNEDEDSNTSPNVNFFNFGKGRAVEFK